MDTGIAPPSDAIPCGAPMKNLVAESDLDAVDLVPTHAEQSKQGRLASEDIAQMPPPKKKAKTTKVQAGQRASKSRRRKDLSTLLNMPLDILFEVFGHLTPKDLVNVSKTTKLLRATLLNRSAMTVWKESRKRLGGPDPPSDITEPQWASLIFTTACTSCGVNNVQAVDFCLRRRMCRKCKQQNLIVEAMVSSEYPGTDLSILNLVSLTSDGGSYWRRDIDHVAKTIKDYQTRMAQGDERAELELTTFKKERTQRVKEIRRDSAAYDPWIEEENFTKKVTLLRERVKTARDRLHQMGYINSDLQNFLYFAREMRVSGKLSDKAWKSFLDLYEPRIFAEKERRREREDHAVRRTRRAKLDGLYDSYKMTLDPSQWKYLPSIDAICCIQPFRGLVIADANETITQASFAACMDGIADVLEAAKGEMQKDLLTQCDNIPVSKRTSAALERVEYSFQCTAGPDLQRCQQVLYGWDEISSHHCAIDRLDVGTSPLDSPTIGIFEDRSPRFREQLPYTLRYSGKRNGAQAVFMAHVSGIRTEAATVAQMDDLDLRYTCLQCDKNGGKAIAYTWRGCIEHLQSQHFEADAFGGMTQEDRMLGLMLGLQIQIIPLPAADADSVKAKEREFERGPDSKWACTHCPAHLTHSIQYTDVIQHVREMHDIDNPEEGVNLISFRRVRKNYAIEYQPTLYNSPKDWIHITFN